MFEIAIDKSETSSQIAKIIDTMKQMDVKIENIKMSPQDESSIQAKFYVKLPRGTTIEQISERIKLHSFQSGLSAR